MIRVAERIWIGDSSVSCRELRRTGITAVLNTAHDLRGDVGWPDVEYMQVGLVDGPGNPQSAYCAAALALASLDQRGRVLVCCHTGGRSLAVVAVCMAMHLDRDWDGIMEVLRERTDEELPVPHEAHRKAFDELNWKLLRRLCI